MLTLSNGTISLLVAQFVAFPTNHIWLLVNLAVVVIVLICPLLVPFLPVTQLSIFNHIKLEEMLL